MSLSRAQTTILVAGIILAAGAALYLMGHPLICKCGYVSLWHFDVMSAENSQHLVDWYTPSHIIHGFAFYWLAWLVAPRAPLGWRLLGATVVEVAWEILENSPVIIDRYRAVTISLDYYGDSVVNSVADIVAMMLGFWLASRLPVWLTVALAVVAEVATTLLIRDGLALNVLMLVWPVEANLVFAMLPEHLDRKLKAAGAAYYVRRADMLPPDMRQNGAVLARMVTSFATTEDEIENFTRLIQNG